ncbi:Threonine synthase [Acidisarcina polymorpha]|uniref:Threonine synthase n=1 Tax=Acidisarcina polymorpha TaxID=2211140 RepID=A0A2Z5FS18_9BACT|nr:threonine synthase [Acidisarcina polymorpha]AXC09532.1 Threonine synthase [Acidisarcina polymorpha]
MIDTVHQLRCTGCSQRVTQREARSNFRCADCGELFEVEYPAWSSTSVAVHAPALVHANGSHYELPNGLGAPSLPTQPRTWMPNASALRWLWKERRHSALPIDQSGVWRFRELLPILENPNDAVTLREGNTPLLGMPRCAQAAGMERLLAKHQGMNPTGSFKDTGMTAALSVARERGFEWVACASTGNTSAAMAAYAARAGLRCLVLIPEGKIAWGKLSQAMDYGALTCQLRTDFDGCVRVLAEVVEHYPIYLLNSVNPYRLEGQKTPALEMAEEMEWNVPDHVIVPGGNLANCSALGKGFQEMKHLGLTRTVPSISVVQAAGANPLYTSMQTSAGRELTPVHADTRASAIRIGSPASWRKAVRILEQTGGFCEQVSEAEIAIAKAEIGREGVGCEPASAVTLAGLKKLVKDGRVKPSENVVLLLTGHTLKDSEYTIEFHRGNLLSEGEARGYESKIAPLRSEMPVLDASADAVLRVLAAGVS